MANLTFDFNSIDRSFLNVKMKDGQVLQVKMPKKKTVGKIGEVQQLQLQGNVNPEDVMDSISAVIAECLSNNLNGIHVTAEQIAEDYDLEDMIQFMDEYCSKFLGGIETNPN